VRIGVISDIHCNIEALVTSLAMMASTVDEVFVAGDVIYEYRFSNEVVSVLRDAGLPCVLGNHEMAFLGPGGVVARSASGVQADLVEWMDAWPTRLETTMDGKKLMMVHGAPWPPYDRYLTPGDPAWRSSDDLGVDFLLTGHTHVPMVRRFGKTLVVNPGSLGESREPGARDLVSFAVVDISGDDADIVRFPNPRLSPSARLRPG
jgi:putative phosphoesterase